MAAHGMWKSARQILCLPQSPNIIFPDADLDAVVAGALRSQFFNQGQVCCAGSRYVDDLVGFSGSVFFFFFLNGLEVCSFHFMTSFCRPVSHSSHPIWKPQSPLLCAACTSDTYFKKSGQNIESTPPSFKGFVKWVFQSFFWGGACAFFRTNFGATAFFCLLIFFFRVGRRASKLLKAGFRGCPKFLLM